MRIAFLIIAHNNLNLVKQLIQKIGCKYFCFYIHFDKRYEIDPVEFLVSINTEASVYFIEDRKMVNWGGWSLTEIMLLLIDTSLEDENFDYLILLSGQDYPLVSSEVILEFYKKNNGKQFIEYIEIPYERWGANGGLDRLQYYWLVDDIGLAKSQEFVRFQVTKGDKRCFPKNLKFFGGSQWFSITGNCAKYLIDFSKRRKDYIDFFKYTLIPDETYIHTIILNSDFAKDTINKNYRYIDWLSGSQKPKVFTHKDFDKVVTSGCHFARKFDLEVDRIIVNKIDAYTDTNSH